MNNASGHSAKFAPVTLHVETKQLIFRDGCTLCALNDEYRIIPNLQRALRPLDGSVNVPFVYSVGCHALQHAAGLPSNDFRGHLHQLAPDFDIDPHILWNVRICSNWRSGAWGGRSRSSLWIDHGANHRIGNV